MLTVYVVTNMSTTAQNCDAFCSSKGLRYISWQWVLVDDMGLHMLSVAAHAGGQPNERARAYIAFYQKVNKAKTHQHRRNTYERHRFKVRQNELVRQLNQAPTRKPTLASIVNYGLTYDPQTQSWTVTTPQVTV